MDGHESIGPVAIAIAIVAGVLASGCAAHVPPGLPDRFISLNGHAMRLHLANRAAAPRPLIVFSSGDGGMHRSDLDAYRHLASWGYPTVGFDSRDYVTHLPAGSETTTPERLAADYLRIIDTARESLGLDADHRVILVGVSRGAGLSVVAAPHLRQTLEGVLAIALTREEEYVRWYRRLPLLREPRAVMVDVYEYLSQLGDLPLAVVQSTHDKYLPADAARRLFGPDSSRRRLSAVDARNHNFGGARDRLYAAMQTALDWIQSSPR